MKVAILDDYQNIAIEMAGLSTVASRPEFSIFHDHVAAPDAVVERLLPFDVICVGRDGLFELIQGNPDSLRYALGVMVAGSRLRSGGRRARRAAGRYSGRGQPRAIVEWPAEVRCCPPTPSPTLTLSGCAPWRSPINRKEYSA